MPVCHGVNKRYQARAKLEGWRRWDRVGGPTKSYRVAVMRMAAAFADHKYKRADVVMTAEYYGPVQLCELVRR